MFIRPRFFDSMAHKAEGLTETHGFLDVYHRSRIHIQSPLYIFTPVRATTHSDYPEIIMPKRPISTLFATLGVALSVACLVHADPADNPTLVPTSSGGPLPITTPTLTTAPTQTTTTTCGPIPCPATVIPCSIFQCPKGSHVIDLTPPCACATCSCVPDSTSTSPTPTTSTRPPPPTPCTQRASKRYAHPVAVG
jgi:hypothetical protein